MNVNPSGRQPLMRPAWYVKEGVRFRQSMVFEGGHLEGQAKGLREVCLERFGEDSIKGKNKTIYRFKKVKINAPCAQNPSFNGVAMGKNNNENM